MGKRKVLVLVFVFLLVVMIGFWLMAPKEKLALNLVFLGYTNEALPTQTPAGLTMVVYSPLALVQVSNSGNYPVELRNALRRTSFQAQDFARPLPYGFPSTLGPAESTIVRVRGEGWRVALGEPKNVPWRTEIAFRRSGARERIFGRIWSVAGRTGPKWLSNINVWPDLYWASCGPITNAFPHVPRLASLTNYFLDLPDAESGRPFNIHEILTNFPPKTSVSYELRRK